MKFGNNIISISSGKIAVLRDSLNVSGTVGYTFSLTSDFQFTASYNLDYKLFQDPHYTETNAGAANVDSNDFSSNSLLLELRLRFGKLFRTSEDLSFLPEVWESREVEYLNTGGMLNTTTSASISGQTNKYQHERNDNSPDLL